MQNNLNIGQNLVKIHDLDQPLANRFSVSGNLELGEWLLILCTVPFSNGRTNP